MKKANIVKENKDFNKIINNNIFVKDSNLVIYFSSNNLNKYRIGISVGTKVGKAYIRNNYKRKLRNIADKYKNFYQNGKDYIIIVRKNCLNASYEEILNSFDILINKIEKEKK